MKIDCLSEEMKWILLKFLKNSLDLLSSPSAKGVQRGKWADVWMEMNLTDERIKEWMPKGEEISNNRDAQE